jgi:uncharacterized membrane protein
LPHLSELHGAATHLAVVAIPVYVLVLVVRRSATRGRVGPARRADAGDVVLATVEPWLLGAAVAGVLAAGATGLLVWGEAQTTLRGQAFRVGSAHFWLGIALAVLVVACAAWRWSVQSGGHPTHSYPMVLGGLLALVLVIAQGYLGGRMTYDEGVGVFAGGQLAQSAAGAKRLDVALSKGSSAVDAGKDAFAASGLGCARCHGDLARGGRGPGLAGGIDLTRFRHVHGDGLFPARIVSDDDVGAIDAWLRTLAPSRRR